MAVWIQAQTPRDLWVKVNKAFILSPQNIIESYEGAQAVSYDSRFQIHSFSPENLDMGIEAGYTRAKWGKLVQGYFHNPSYEVMLERAKYYWKKGKIIPSLGMVFLGSRLSITETEARTSMGGPCLLSFSILRRKNSTPKVTIHSRSSEVSQRLYADLVFIYVLLRHLGEELDFTPEEVSVDWFIPKIYQNFFQVIPFLIISGLEEELPNLDHRWPRRIYREYKKGVLEGNTPKYAVRRRVNEHCRFLKFGEGEFESITTDQLNLPV